MRATRAADLPNPSYRGRAAGVCGLTLVLVAGLASPGGARADDGPAGAGQGDGVSHTAEDAAFELVAVGRYETGVFDESAAEIVAYHARSNRLFTVNAQAGLVEVLDVADPTEPLKVADLIVAGTVDADGVRLPEGTVANSVAVRRDGLGVVAVEAPVKTDAGWLVLFDATADPVAPLGAVRVGSQPDMVVLSRDGRQAVVANEGEPDDDYTVDPEGSVSVVALPVRPGVPSQDAVRTADFHDYEAAGAVPAGVRIFGPAVNADRPVSANLEPEYVTIQGGTAYVTLQEANAVAVVDLAAARVTDIWPLGFRDHGVAGLDPSDRDSAVDIRTVPGLRGLPMPDAIASYTSRGRTYLVTANEGDAREWGDYVEGVRVKDLGEDGVPPLCDESPLRALTGDADLGRLNVTTASGLRADGSCFDDLYAFGTRSFSVWDTDGRLVFDSAEAFEQITAEALPDFFNSNHTEANLEGRSDDKGPEPEGVAVGQVRGRTYAFVGLERVGGVMVFDVTRPTESTFVTYVNTRDFGVTVDEDDPSSLSGAGDLGPEGLAFLPAGASPTGQPMLVVASEVSGTTTLFALDFEVDA